ncbi:MAG: NAD(P)H oxidoreductase [Rhodothermales bacterium]|nr:NAD(P)H oxidoreductase [Rhodothermales bacterium]
MRTLILFAHPSFEKSRIHAALVSKVPGDGSVTFRDLYQRYPDFDIDVEAEQKLLVDHDLIVLQHPLYWYSVPPLMKQWIDLVLEHGWAYGRDGRALEGKTLMCLVSAGGTSSAYRSEGHNKYTVREFLRPIEQTAKLCRMNYWAPYVVHGTHRLGEPEIQRHAERYRALLDRLATGRIDPDEATAADELNRIVEDGGRR